MNRRVPQNIDRAVYTIPEVAAMLGINLITVYELARRPDFPAVRIGKRIVVPKAALANWLDRQANKD